MNLRRLARAASLAFARLSVRLVPPSFVTFVWRNPLLDRDFYLARYPDVRRQGLDARFHYRRHVAREQREPNALFDTACGTSPATRTSLPAA